MQNLLAGVGRQAQPRSGHDVTCPDINLDFPEAHVGCEALEAAMWLLATA